MNGAEPIDPHAVRAFQEKFQSLGLRDGVVRPVYGLAESSLAVTFGDPGRVVLDEVDADRLEREGSRNGRRTVRDLASSFQSAGRSRRRKSASSTKETRRCPTGAWERSWCADRRS